MGEDGRPRYISPETIEAIARAITNGAKLDEGEPGAIDIVKLAQYLGCEVEVVEFDADNVSAKIQHKKGDGCLIQVSSGDGPKRQRFSIAHELSHYLLHDQKEEFIEYRKRALADYDDPSALYKEVQANMLAAALLMPKQLVIRAWETTKDLDDLAEIFNVSRATAYYRLDNLELLGSE